MNKRNPRQFFTRPLGATEQAAYLHDCAHPLHFALTAQVKGEIDFDAVNIALTHLQQRHPLLRVSITVDRNGKPYFVEQTNPIPLRIVSRQGADNWEKELERELAQPFTSNDAPLVRVVWLHSVNISELIITCHHAIADGLSAVNLVRDLLAALGTIHQPLPSLPTPTPLEMLLPNYQPQPSHIWQILITKVLLWLKKLTAKTALPQRNYPCLRSGVLSPVLTTTLIQRCRDEKTTVHAALCAAFVLAIAYNHTQKSTFKCLSPISLRPFLTSSVENDCGFYISPALTTHTLTSDFTFWQMAHSVKAQLLTQTMQENLQSKAIDYEKLMAANPSQNMVLEIFKERFGFDLMITNLGCLNLSQQFGKLYLQAIYGPAVMSGVENERVLGVATLGDKLFFTFVYPQSLSSTATPHLLEQAIKLLETAISIPSMTLSMAQELLSDTKV